MADFENPFDPFGDFADPPRSRFRVTRFEARQKLQEQRAGLPAFPLPIPTQGNPFPFPTGPAANDPIFRPPVGIGGVILAGGIGIIIATTGVQIAERVAKLKKKRKEDEERAEEENRKRREERVAAEGRIKTIPSPEFPEKIPDRGREIPEIFSRPRPGDPSQIPARFPTRVPPPLEIPQIEFPIPVPSPGKGPQTLPFPESLPVPGLPSPVPVPRPAPAPSTQPGIGVPRTLPRRLPGRFPFPPGQVPQPGRRSRPQRRTKPQPAGDPLPEGLTAFRPQGVGFVRGFADVSDQPDPSAEAQTERCRVVKRRRRRKDKCTEGLFREFPGETEYTSWREVDCVTRKEPSKPDDRDRDEQGRFQ